MIKIRIFHKAYKMNGSNERQNPLEMLVMLLFLILELKPI